MTMNRIAAFMRLDFRSLQTVIFITLLPFLSLVIVSPSFIHSYGVAPWYFSILVIMLSIVQPLINAEKSKLGTLYSTLPLTRDDIVKARYLYFVCVSAVVILPALLLKLLFFKDNEWIYFYMAVTFSIMSFFAAVSYPLYFIIRGVITKAVIFIMFYSFICGTLSGYWREIFALVGRTNYLAPAMAGLILFCLSYPLSLKIYRTRDL